MATGSSNMTTYKASQVIGNDTAQNPAGALLQSGAGRADNSTTGDTWIFLDTYSGTTSPWGIKHSQGDDKIKIIGNSTDGFWVTMNTGDTYILGKVGIGYNPETSGNTYKLYVNGTSYFNGNTTHNGIDYFANGTTYYIDNSANARLGDVYTNVTIGYNSAAFVLSPAGSPWPFIRFDTRAGGTTYVTTDQTNWCELYAQVPAKRASDNAYYKTRFFFRQYSKTANTTTRLGYYEDYYLPETNDDRTGNAGYDIRTSKSSAYNVDTATHLSSAPNNTTTFYRGDKTWTNVLGGAFQANGTITANGGYLKSTLNSNTVQIGSQNTGFCHITNSADIPFWFNKNIYLEQGKTIGAAGTQYRPFQLYLGRYSTTAGNALNTANPLIEFSNSDRSQYCQLMYDDHDSLVAPDSLTLVGNQNGIFFICKNGPIWVQGGSNAGGNQNRLTTTSGMPGNMQYNVSRRGTQIYSNGIAFCDPYNGNSNSDAGWIRHQETTSNAGELEIAVGDDGDETVVVRQYNTSNGIKRTLTLLSKDGYTFIPSYLNIGGHEKNASSPTYVWGSNSSDNYLRSYQTSKLSVATAASCTGNAASATYASSYLANRGSVSGTNHAEALKAYFNSNKASEPRNCLVAHYSSAHGNGSLCMGYFLNGYDSSPYGGFFVCHYNNPRYVGISNGTYTQQDILTSTNYTSWTVTKTGSGASGSWGISVTGSSGSCTGNAATATKATKDGSGNTITSYYCTLSTAQTFTGNKTFNSICYFANGTSYYVNKSGDAVFKTVKNAVWNDYAEYRKCDLLPAGTCVQENDNGNLTISDARLIPGASIISDTYGFVQGETDEAHTPIAVSGRVLAYTFQPRSEYHAGMVVCSAPGGTVDIMTREEIQKYPDAIIGIVSEIPDYDTWGTGNVKVNGRIWIKIK